MGSLKERFVDRLDTLRARRPSVDHVVRTFVHYSDRDGNAQAGAVTFFGFLSFFPILALSFFVVGYISAVYPDLRADVVELLEEVLPGVIGNGDGEIALETFEEYAGAVGLVGLAGLVYSGLGWLSGMRRALAVMFRLPRQEHPNFLLGRARDLGTLVMLGVVLLVSIGLSGVMSWFSGLILGWLGLDGSWVAAGVLWVVTHGLAIGATGVLFVAMFRLLAHPQVAGRALWQGALAGAVGFEVLKAVAGFLIAQTKDQPAFQAFGVALILLVWINYFSRLVMLSASWAYTAPVAVEVRALESEPLVTAEETEVLEPAPAAVAPEDPSGAAPRDGGRGRRLAARLGVASLGVAGLVAGLSWLGRRSRR